MGKWRLREKQATLWSRNIVKWNYEFQGVIFSQLPTSQGTGKEQKIVRWVDRLGRKYSPLVNPEWLWKTLQSIALTFECIVEISFCDPSNVTTSAVFSHGPDCFVCSCSFWVWRKCYCEMLWCDHANRTSSSTIPSRGAIGFYYFWKRHFGIFMFGTLGKRKD